MEQLVNAVKEGFKYQKDFSLANTLKGTNQPRQGLTQDQTVQQVILPTNPHQLDQPNTTYNQTHSQ